MKNQKQVTMNKESKLQLVDVFASFAKSNGHTNVSKSENSVTVALPLPDSDSLYITNYFTITFNDDHYRFTADYYDTEINSMYYGSDHMEIVNDFIMHFEMEERMQPLKKSYLYSLN